MNTTLPSQSIDTEADLVTASLSGDTTAFGRLITRHQNLVTGICYAVLGRRSLAEEAAQESFVIAWRQLATLQDPARFRPWLAGIARHVALNRHRAQQRDPLLAADSLETAADAGIDPAEEATAREEEAIVDHEIAGLPADYREALVLYYRDDQSTAAVAAALEISEEAVRQRLARGRRLLQERVLERVERTLRRTAPGAGFAIAVLALLPAPSAPAAVMGSALPLATGLAVGTAGASLGAHYGWIGAAIGCLSGALGGWLGARRAFAQSRTPAQHHALAASAWRIGLLALAYVGAMCACTFNFATLRALHAALPWTGVIVLTVAYLVALTTFIARTNRRFARLG